MNPEAQKQAPAKTRRWLFAGLILLLIAVSVGIGISQRNQTAFPKFYDLAFAIGEGKAIGTPPPITSSGGTWVLIRHSGSAATFNLGLIGTLSGGTVFVFPKERADEVQKAYDRYFPSPPTGLISYSLSGTSTPFGLAEARKNGRFTAMIVRGAPAEEMAKNAGLTLPPGGTAISVDEAPDWFTVKIHAILRFLHLR